jgi:trehalose/maltose transport system permease protein
MNMATVERAAPAVVSGQVRGVAPRSQLSRQRVRAAWLFLTPMLIILAVVAAWPLIKTIWFGFTDATLDNLGEAKFIGFRNYLEYVDYGDGTGEWFGLLADSLWWHAVRNTIWFTVISVVCETILGMVVALVLNAKFPGRGLIRAAILIPWAIPTIVSAKMWGWMLNDQFGIINDILLRLHIISEPVAWTANVNTALAAVLVVDIWKTTPFMALLILAGLQMLPGDIYEAAKIDGVHPLKVFWKITLPLVRPALMVAIIFRGLDALRIFDLIYVLTPNNAQTTSMSVYARQNLFDFDKFSYGSAASTFLFLVILIITIIYIKVGRLNFEGGR